MVLTLCEFLVPTCGERRIEKLGWQSIKHKAPAKENCALFRLRPSHIRTVVIGDSQIFTILY